MSDNEILIATTLFKFFDANQKVVISPSAISKSLNTGSFAEGDETKIKEMIYSICLVISKDRALPSLFFEKMTKSDSHLLSVDFRNPAEASEMINSLVLHQTKKIIQKLVYNAELEKDMSCFLGSAATFIKQWDYPFEKPILSTFYSTPPRQCQFICQKEGVGWYFMERNDWKCLRIPYKHNQYLHIWLPQEKGRLPELLKNFDASILKESYGQGNVEANTKIPVFEIESRINLEDKGLPAFHALDTPDSSLHVAKFKIDEYGTYAEAFKDDGARCAAEFPQQDFIADHPFLFFVTYREIPNSFSIQFIGIFS